MQARSYPLSARLPPHSPLARRQLRLSAGEWRQREAPTRGAQVLQSRAEVLQRDLPRRVREVEQSAGRAWGVASRRSSEEIIFAGRVKVLGLKRVRIGGLSLSRKLGPGKYEALTEAQVNTVLNLQ